MSLSDTTPMAVDFSDMSRDVLRFARRLASTSPGSHLVVAHVVRRSIAPAIYRRGDGRGLGSAQRGVDGRRQATLGGADHG